jgi:hypothetical protein
MRIFLAILASVTLLSASAQTHLPVSPWGLGSSPWQLRPSAGLSAGYIFFNGGISYLSAPLSLNLYHPLTTNITAYAGVSVTPTVFNFGSLYATPYQNPGFAGSYNLSINPAIQGGLIYTNDAHTFSISGGVRVQRGSYPVYPSQQLNYHKIQ